MKYSISRKKVFNGSLNIEYITDANYKHAKRV